ncbi:MAG: TonB-dependent receptor [Anaerolineae bacterium]|nr:TonB-dependent receptor [Gloeobacterales cyanobacterium ES-bin-313]
MSHLFASSRLGAACIVLLSISSPAWAEEPPTTQLPAFLEQQLSQPVFTPFRQEAPLRDASRPVYVITRGQIEAQGARTVQESLKYLPGILSDGTAGTQLGAQSGQFIRGSSGAQVLILLDGRPINDIGFQGGYDLSTLTTDNVERIEVTPGGGSTLYGADAVGGTINIVTLPAGEAPRTKLQGAFGSFGLNEESLQTSGQGGNLSWILGYRRIRSQNDFAFAIPGTSATRQNADALYNNLNGKLALKLNDRQDLQLNTFWNNKELGVPGGVPTADPNSIGAFNSLTPDTRQTTGDLLNDLSFKAKLGNGEDSLLTARLSLDVLNYSFNAPDSFGTKDLISRTSLGAQVQHNWQITDNQNLTYGIDYRQVKALNQTLDYFSGLTNTNYDRSVSQTAFFVQDAIALSPDFRLNLGVRQDFSNFGSSTSPSIGVKWEVSETTTLRANYARSFRAPLVSELFYKLRGFFNLDGNPNLSPERGDTYDIGIDQILGDFGLLRVTGFINNIQDNIAFVFSPDFTSGTYTNLGQVRSQGIEAALNVKLGNNLYLTSNYTAVDPRILASTNPVEVNKEKAFVGADSFNLGLSYEKPGGIFAGLFLRTIGSTFVNNTNTETLQGYTTLDLKLRVPVTANLSINAQLNNLLDRQYQVYPGFPGVGANFRVGLSLTF